MEKKTRIPWYDNPKRIFKIINSKDVEKIKELVGERRKRHIKGKELSSHVLYVHGKHIVIHNYKEGLLSDLYLIMGIDKKIFTISKKPQKIQTQYTFEEFSERNHIRSFNSIPIEILLYNFKKNSGSIFYPLWDSDYFIFESLFCKKIDESNTTHPFTEESELGNVYKKYGFSKKEESIFYTELYFVKKEDLPGMARTIEEKLLYSLLYSGRRLLENRETIDLSLYKILTPEQPEYDNNGIFHKCEFFGNPKNYITVQLGMEEFRDCAFINTKNFSFPYNEGWVNTRDLLFKFLGNSYKQKIDDHIIAIRNDRDVFKKILRFFIGEEISDCGKMKMEQ